MGLGPLDMQGPQFLWLYAGLLVAALLISYAVPLLLRPRGFATPVGNVDELAYLSGGEARYAEALVARLLEAGKLEMMESRTFRVKDKQGAAGVAEQRLLSQALPFGWDDVRKELKPDAAAIEQRLIARGVLLDAAARARLRMWQAGPLALLGLLGLAKLAVGWMRDKPVGFLVVLLVVTGVVATLRAARLNPRTSGGETALASARMEADRLRRAPAGGEMGMAVALFGTAVLADSALASLHRMRTASSSSGSDSSSSSDDSSCSSDSGGGCGGCGGD